MKLTNSFKFYMLMTALLFSTCFLESCERMKPIVLTNYATSYSLSRDFSIFPVQGENIYTLGIWQGDIVSYSSKGTDLDSFKKLAYKNGDTSYHEIVEYGEKGGIFDRRFFSEQISRITITCDKSVDDKHPAGSSLNDLFLFFSGSPDQFIKNGYKQLDINRENILANVDARFKSHVNSFFNTLKLSSDVVYGKLSDIDFQKYRLLGGMIDARSTFAMFGWVSIPENISDYTLYVELEFIDGVKKRAEIKV